MSFTWLYRTSKDRSPKTGRGRGQRRPRGWFRLEVETLETRCLMSAAVLGSNVLVNNPAEDLGASNVQSTTAVAVAGPNVVVAYTDNGSLLGSSNQVTGWAVSTDGGASFTDKGALPASASGDAGDPALAYSSQGSGNLFLATPARSGAGIQVFESADNGGTFNVPVNAASGFSSTDALDLPRIAVDNFSGAGKGNIYLTFGDLAKGTTPNGIYFTQSTDGGVTWSSATQLAIKNAFGSQVVVGPDHTIYVLWLDQNSSTTQIMYSKSINLGGTFSAAAPVVSLTNTAANGDLGLAGGFATNSFPQVAVNPVTGDLYVAYNDVGLSPDKADIFFTQSANKGVTWSTASKVNDDKTTNDQWDPALAVTPDGLRLGIFWYDRRSDPANTLIERWGTVGTIASGTATFATPNFVVQDAGTAFPVILPTDPKLPSKYMGDFDGVAPSTDGNFFYAAWGDNRDGNVQGPNVRLAKVSTARPPVAVPDFYHIDPTASALTVNAANGVLANDTDVDGDPLKVVVASVVQPTNGTVAMSIDGSFTFTPGVTFLLTGTATFTYKATDSDGDSAPALVTITTGNVPPLARNDAYTAAPNSTLNLSDPALGLLANDTDFDGKSLVVDLATVTQPANGKLAVNADGTFTYTPNTDYKGVDSFTYKAKEVAGSPLDSNTATVTLTVALSSNSWAPFGPGPVTASGQGSQAVAGDGRVTGIAADPTNAKKFYITAAGGGVWKTTDGGLSWAPLTDNQATLSMGAIAVAPSNPLVLYAGTGEANNTSDSQYGLGILKSTNGGATWTLLTGNAGKNEFNRRTISRIVVDPTDPTRVYAAVSDNGTNGLFGNTGIWRSTDGGTTWTNTTLSIDPTASNPFTDLVINPSTSGSTAVLYAAVGNPFGASINGVYKSVNGGDTWSAAGNFPLGSSNNSATGRIAIAISPSTPTTLYAAIASSGLNGSTAGALLQMLVSTDGGTRWNALGTTPDYMSISQVHDGIYDTALAVDPSNPSIVYAGGLNLYQSTTGGLGWTPVSGYPAGNGIHAFAFDKTGNLLVGDTSGVWRLSKGVLTNITGNLQIAQFNGVAVDPTQTPIAYGGTQDNGTIKTIGPLEWFPIASGSGGVNMSGGFVLIDPNNSSIIYHTFTGVSLQRSIDGGKTWANITKGITVNSSDPAPDAYVPYAIDNASSTHLLLGTNSLWESFDSGATWRAIGGPGTAGWSGNAPIDNIAISTFQPTGNPPVTTIYVTTGGDGASSSTNNHVFTTQYNPQTYLPGTTVLTWQKIDVVAQETNSQGQIVNQVFNDHFGQMVVDPTNPEVVYAVRDRFTGALDGHVFRTQDGGNNWQDISSTLPDVPFHTVALDAVNHVLLIGSDNAVYSSNNFDKTSVTWQQFGAQLPNAVVAQLQVLPGSNLVVAGTHGRGLFEIQERQPPVAVPDSYSTLLNTTLVVDATTGIPGLLVNDTDPVGDKFSLILGRRPLNGSLSITDPNSPKGYFTYKPDNNFRGTDTFTYKDFDPLLNSFGNTTTVTITVSGTPPTATSPSPYTTTINTPLTIPKAQGLLAPANVSEPAPVDALTPTVKTGPANGVVTVNADGSFTYTPTMGFVGTDLFTYVDQDALDGDSNPATVTIRVKPVANDDSYSMQINGQLTPNAAAGVLANDLFHSGDVLALMVTTPQTHGVLALNNDGSFTYTPTAGFNGTDSFKYTLRDNGLTSAAATVSISVSPLAAVADSYGPVILATNLIGTLNVTTKAQGLLGNDLDDAAGTPTLQVDTGAGGYTQPANGSVVVNANGTFTYTSNAGFRGTDTFTYKAKDSIHGDSLPATVTITVRGPAPTANNDPAVGNTAFYTVATNGTLTVNTAHGVLANDVKLSDDTLTAVLNAGPTHGTLTGGLASDGSFMYVPNTAYFGTDTFTYHAHGAKDGDSNVATVTITVAPQPPTAAAHSYTTTINFHYSGSGLLTGATDPQNQTPFTAKPATTATTQGGSVTVNANGTFLYIPPLNFEGTDTFTYKVKDAINLTSASATVTLTVTPFAANDPSYTTTANNKLVVNAAGGVLANDTFRTGDVAVLGVGPANGTLVGGLNADGSFTYLPNTGFSGADTFTYVVQDATAPGGPVQSSAATVTITINPLLKGSPVTFHAFADPFSQRAPFSGAIGFFTSATANVTKASFSVLSINWGDGTVDTTSGAIVQTGPGSFSVTGTHRFTRAAKFGVTITVRDSLGNTLTLQATAIVGYALF